MSDYVDHLPFLFSYRREPKWIKDAQYYRSWPAFPNYGEYGVDSEDDGQVCQLRVPSIE